MQTKRSAEVQVGLAWNWQYDREFIQAIDQACHKAGLTCYLVGHHNLQQTFLEVQAGERRFAWFLDRASDEDKHFLQFNQLLHATGTRFLNAHQHYLRASDKAEIHRELLGGGLHLPLTLVLPPHDREPNINPAVIETFAKPFVIKPAKGGGGKGVVIGATKVEQVIHTRAQQRDQRFLIQQSIEPRMLGGKRAWFRVYYVCGQVIPCWWDDRTHRYAVMTPADHNLVNVTELERIVRIVAQVSVLDFFSSEIALDRTGRYVIIDYVNTPCDMRPQSKNFNGVPDIIVQQIVTIIVAHLKQQFPTTAPSTSPDDWLWP